MDSHVASNSSTSSSVTSNMATSAASAATVSSSPPRKPVESKDPQAASLNPFGEEEEESVEELPKKQSPTNKWIDSSVVFIDCFGEAVGREKMDQADIIGVSEWILSAWTQ